MCVLCGGFERSRDTRGRSKNVDARATYLDQLNYPDDVESLLLLIIAVFDNGFFTDSSHLAERYGLEDRRFEQVVRRQDELCAHPLRERGRNDVQQH